MQNDELFPSESQSSLTAEPSENGSLEATKTGSKKRRTRSYPRPFPAVTFEDALDLAKARHAYAGGLAVRRLTLFEKTKQVS